MATTTVSGTTVTFSNSGAAANLTQSGTEDGSLQFTFDVLAASDGGVKTTIYSADDGAKNDDGGAAIVVTNKAYVDYNKDLLMQDGVGISFSQTSQMGATFWIGSDNQIHYDAAGLSAEINALDAGEMFKDTIQYTIKMSNGTLSVGTLTVVINGINDAPVLSATAATLSAGAEDTPYTISTADLLAGFTDAEGDQMSVSGLTANHGALVDNNDGTWTFTPDANYNGPVSLSYTVRDGHGGSVPATQSFTLTAVNDAPVLSGTAATLVAGTEDTPYTFSTADLLAGFTDVDGDQLSVAGLTANHGALVDNNDGSWTFTPDAN
ncbi:cadherin-like domain-containing protein, partial [Rhizobium etli]